MGLKEQFKAVADQADPHDVWAFDRCQAAIDALDAQTPAPKTDDDTVSPETQSIITERARQRAIQYRLLEKTLIPLDGDEIAAQAYAEFAAENPPPK